jgi:hypothetical protein
MHSEGLFTLRRCINVGQQITNTTFMLQRVSMADSPFLFSVGLFTVREICNIGRCISVACAPPLQDTIRGGLSLRDCARTYKQDLQY